ncbi:MAG: hypothetical protein F6J92_02895 [Symploca sp. SIO1A3]|nr:hypothetical protein [Symploca sp. SIO1A3]
MITVSSIGRRDFRINKHPITEGAEEAGGAGGAEGAEGAGEAGGAGGAEGAGEAGGASLIPENWNDLFLGVP